MNRYGANGLGYKTETAGTEIIHTIPPSKEGVGQITSLSYTDGGTAHTIYVMREFGRTITAAAAVGGATTFTGLTDASPTGFVANGFATIQLDKGVHTSKITSWTSASGTLILGTGIPSGSTAAAGNKVWNHGNLTQADPQTGVTHPVFKTPGNASVPLTLPAVAGLESLIGGLLDESPIAVVSDNATTAGKFNSLTYQHARPS